MNLFALYQSLEIYLFNLSLHGIVLNFLDQYVVGSSLKLEKDLAALIAGLQKLFRGGIFRFLRGWNR